MKALLATLALALLAATASADSIWDYQGQSAPPTTFNNMFPANPCQCALTGSVTLDTLGNAIAWNFTDGTHTLDQTDSTASIITSIFPNPTSPFESWHVTIVGQTVIFVTSYYFSSVEATDFSTVDGNVFELVVGNHGTWTDSPASTLEPGTFLLLGVGLAGLLLRKRKKAISGENPLT